MTEYMIPPSKMKRFCPELEKDIPIPMPKHTRIGIKLAARRDFFVRYPFDKMELWDSFFVPGHGRNTLKVCCHKSTQQRGHRYAVRQWRQPDGAEGLRCWRIF